MPSRRQQAERQGQARAMPTDVICSTGWERGCRHRPVSLSELTFLVRAGAKLLMLEPDLYSLRGSCVSFTLTRQGGNDKRSL